MATLDLPLREEQRWLQESVQRFRADNAHPGWCDLSESLSLAGVALPESVGGFGGGAIDIALVMAELGPALAGADWLSHVAASALLARAAPSHPSLGDLAAGRRRIAIICAASTAAMPVVERGLVRGSATLVAVVRLQPIPQFEREQFLGFNIPASAQRQQHGQRRGIRRRTGRDHRLVDSHIFLGSRRRADRSRSRKPRGLPVRHFQG